MSSCSHSSAPVSELHSSIVLIILVKLPTIKSIIRCKCVCKAWCKLILDPYFTKIYSKSPALTDMMVVRSCPKKVSNSENDTFNFLGIGSNGDVVHTPFNLKQLPRIGNNIKVISSERRIVDSCNGLLCIAETAHCLTGSGNKTYINHQNVWVINPLTDERKKFPQVHEAKCCDQVIYGFGSTVDGNYYKVVRIITPLYTTTSGAKILTIGVDDEWREFDEPANLNNFGFRPSLHGTVLDGVLHWYCWNTKSRFIYALDIGTETGHCIPLPPGGRSRHSHCLSVWGGYLCLTQIDEQFEMWTMKQYGVAESWTRDITVDITTARSWTGDLMRRQSIRHFSYHISSVGLTMYLMRSDLCGQNIRISFDPETKKYVNVKKVFDDEETVTCVFGYVPSFCSLGDMISTVQVTNGDF